MSRWAYVIAASVGFNLFFLSQWTNTMPSVGLHFAPVMALTAMFLLRFHRSQHKALWMAAYLLASAALLFILYQTGSPEVQSSFRELLRNQP